MRLISEIVDDKSKILVVSLHRYLFINILKESLENLGSEFFYSPNIPSNTSLFEYMIIIDYEKPLKNLVLKNKKIVLIYLNNSKRARLEADFLFKNKVSNVKIINISEGKISEREIEKIIWFIFTTDKEKFLHLELFQNSQRFKTKLKTNKKIKEIVFKLRKKILKYLFILIFLFYLSVIPFQMMSFYFTYKSASFLRNEKINKAKIFLSYSENNLIYTNFIYKLTRPAYLLLSLALLPDNLFEINKISNSVIKKIILISENGKYFLSDLIKTKKSEDELRSQLLRLDLMSENMQSLQKDLKQLYQKIPEKPVFFKKIKIYISDQINILTNTEILTPYLKDILGVNGEKKYLLLFANNMELRPGGGFIGSYGILNINKLTIEKIEVFDVYDADGQLKEHVNPPLPIRKYLNQPNWYLRDSAFSFDFSENYDMAKMFLQKELKINEFSGGIIITTTAIQNLLEAMNEIYLPDYEEKINKDNFYIKAQLHSEKDFFPGSIQKKSFLGSLTRQILLNLNSSSFSNLLRMINKSLDEKQIAIIFDEEKIQNVLNTKYWSGKIISPNCLYQINNCIVDYLFPVDANLGVNKANFFISKTHKLNIKITETGEIKNELTIKIKNESQNNIFPGGTYKNYFQLALPVRSLIKKITINDTLVENFETTIDIFKTVGFLVEIKPQKEVELKINYELQQPYEKGEGVYQLIFQKQIGSKNSDFSLVFDLPKNIIIDTQNFSPVVKDNLIIYNTSLTSDKIYLLKFIIK